WPWRLPGHRQEQSVTLFEELFVSSVGGVITAVILAVFSGSSRSSRRVRRSRSEPVEAERTPRRRGGFVSGFFSFLRVLIAVTAGIAIAMVGGRWLIQNGVLPRGLPTRFGLLIGGTLVVWLLLGIFRRR
ncbi:MAG: hypothetical protein AAFY64_09765, partial [Pseudomonadota bacterium]